MPRLLNASSHLTGPTLNRQKTEFPPTVTKYTKKMKGPTAERKGISWPQCHSETQEGPRHLDMAGWLDNSKRQIPEHICVPGIQIWMTKLMPIYISRK